MKKSKLAVYALVQALGVLAYVSAVTLFMRNASSLMGSDDTFWSPIIMLMLLVSSASVSGALVFGRSIFLYLDGLKKESVLVLAYTIGFLLLIISLVVSGIILF